MSASVAHELQRFRYITVPTHPLPWPHVRYVNIAELRHDAPDLPLMANLISGLADCDLSLKEIREHTDSDVLQLAQVLQAALQFALWSQNVLKERLLEAQATHAAKRVSARQLEALEARHRALEKAMAAVVEERDTLSLGTANLRTAVAQLETTVKLQEQQLRHERGRNAQLLTKLENAFAAQAAAPASLPAPPRPETAGVHARHRRRHSPAAPVDASHDDSAATATTSDTSYEAPPAAPRRWRQRERGSSGSHAYVPAPSETLSPPPPPLLDWRTLVRYILHEERQAPAWVAAAPPPPVDLQETPTDAGTTSVAPRTIHVAAPASTERSTSAPPALLSSPAAPAPPPVTEAQVRSFFAELSESIATDAAQHAHSVVAHAEELVRTLAGQSTQKTAAEQQSLMTEVRAALHHLRTELKACTQHQHQHQQAHREPPTREEHLSSVERAPAAAPAAAVAAPTSIGTGRTSGASSALGASALRSASSPPRVPIWPDSTGLAANDAKAPSPVLQHSSPPAAAAASLNSSNSASYFSPFLAGSGPPRRALARHDSQEDAAKSRTPLPDFSVDILRTPSGSDDGRPASPSSTERGGSPEKDVGAEEEEENDVDVDLMPINTPSIASASDSHVSSDDKAQPAGRDSPPAFPRMLAKPSTAPPVYPSKAPPASSPPAAASAAGAHTLPHRTLSLHSSMRSDASEGSSHGSSLMLRETRAQLQALLAEEEAAEKARQLKKAGATSPS